MANESKNNGRLKLYLFTMEGELTPVECDCVKLSVADDKDGGFQGLYGIRFGHAKSVFALCPGKITATLDGKNVFSAKTGGGFALTDGKTVNVTVEKAEMITE
ncbi:MAG: hypothetical protein PUC33_04535 [Oscillospiraceae bacterium]|nr:hypothetical protein [Oscillospiraceae bacterium]